MVRGGLVSPRVGEDNSANGMDRGKTLAVSGAVRNPQQSSPH